MDRANLINYESDSSDEEVQGEESSGDERANVAWSKSKQSYYAKGESSGSDDSENDEDQLKEAQRLQEIRRKKIAK